MKTPERNATGRWLLASPLHLAGIQGPWPGMLPYIASCWLWWVNRGLHCSLMRPQIWSVHKKSHMLRSLSPGGSLTREVLKIWRWVLAGGSGSLRSDPYGNLGLPSSFLSTKPQGKEASKHFHHHDMLPKYRNCMNIGQALRNQEPKSTLPPLSCFFHVGSDWHPKQIKSWVNVYCEHEHGHVKDRRIISKGN